MSEMRREGLLVSYHPELLWADSMGERELPSGSDNSSLPTSNQPSLSPWSHAPTRPLLPDGRDSLFGLLQPSDTRRIELAVPFEPKAAERQAIALERSQIPGSRPRFDSNPCPSTSFFENGYPGSSIFQQTEEMIAKEAEERVDGAIQQWIDKLVVDEPVVHVNLRVKDRPAQLDRLHGMLDAPPKKKSIKRLYNNKKPLSYADSSHQEPSAFMHESTIEQISKFESTLRPHNPHKWAGENTHTPCERWR
ncbi:MAG: hypothetical protein SGPRY_012383 [Prymnesium sp.]